MARIKNFEFELSSSDFIKLGEVISSEMNQTASKQLSEIRKRLFHIEEKIRVLENVKS